MTQKPTYEELKKRLHCLTAALKKSNAQLEHQIIAREQAEKKLRVSEENRKAKWTEVAYISLMENLPGITYRCALDKDWTMLYISKQVDQVSGYPASDFINNAVRTYKSVIHPEDTAYVDMKVNEAVKSRIPWEIEYRIVNKNGAIRWTYEKGKGIAGKDGEIKYLDGFILDITERKLTEEALRDREQKFSAILDQTFEFVGLMTPDGTLTEANRTALQFAGIEESDVIGKPFWETPWWTHSQNMQALLQDAIKEAAKGKFIRFGATHPASDGTLHDVDFSIKPVKNEAGNVTLLIPEGRDITERKRAEEALRESEEKYRSLVNLSPDPIIIIQDGRHQMISAAFTKVFGYTQQDVDNGLGAFDLIHKDYRNIVRKRSEDRFAGKQLPQTLGLDMMAKDGSIIPCESSGTLIQYNGRPAILVIIRDITERKKLEKVLIHREKLKTLGAIAAEVAHEIRNPLTSLGGFAKRLKKKYPDSYECDIIINETQRLEGILSRIRNYLEPVDIYAKKCSINGIISSCVHLLSPETESRGVKCELELDTKLPLAYADPGILAQIIINLIRNATEAAAKGGIVFIRSFESDQDLQIEFKNRVLCSKHKDPETIFMPFAEGGRSVGLPLCYRLLKDMGGHLSFVQDQDFMVFTVSLPKR